MQFIQSVDVFKLIRKKVFKKPFHMLKTLNNTFLYVTKFMQNQD